MVGAHVNDERRAAFNLCALDDGEKIVNLLLEQRP